MYTGEDMNASLFDQADIGGAKGMGADAFGAKEALDGAQHGFTHYRRSKTNKAPRKRSFIANMSKCSPQVEALESASKGVGLSAGGVWQGLQMPHLLPNSGPGQASMGGVQNGTTPFSDLFNVPFTSDLPPGLASLPTVGNPVVWGSKQSPLPQPTISQRNDSQHVSFTELLQGIYAPAAATLPAHSHQFSADQVAGLPSFSSSASAVTTVASQLQAAPSAASSKVSFDLFPELAALAVSQQAVHHGLPISSHASRAVVTSMEGSNMACYAALPPAAMTNSAGAPAPSHSGPAATASPAASISPHGSGSVGSPHTSSTTSTSAQHPSPVHPAAPQQLQLQQVMSDSAVSKPTGASSPVHPSHAQQLVPSLAGSAAACKSSSSMSLAGSGPAVMAAAGLGLPQHCLPLLMLPAWQSAMLNAAASCELRGETKGGRKERKAPAASKGRGTKRGLNSGLTGAGSSAGAANPAANAPNWVTVAAASPAGMPANPPFVLPLHGMSASGAVLPGAAGQLCAMSLVSVGAYGVVYRGRWQERDVAVKMMRIPQASEGLSAADVLQSFRHEAALLSGLAHPNIMPVRHSQDVEPVCIVQEYAAHGTLADYIHAAMPSPASFMAQGASSLECTVLRNTARRFSLQPDQVIANLEARSVMASGAAGTHANQALPRRYVVLLCLLRDVAAACTYLAAPTGGNCPPVVHRDIKPSNILLSQQGFAMLADFGVAKTVTPPQVASAPTSLHTAASTALLPSELQPRALSTHILSPASPSAASSAGTAIGMDTLFDEWPGDAVAAALTTGNKRARLAEPAPAPAPASTSAVADVDLEALLDAFLGDDTLDFGADTLLQATLPPPPPALPALPAPLALPARTSTSGGSGAAAPGSGSPTTATAAAAAGPSLLEARSGFGEVEVDVKQAAAGTHSGTTSWSAHRGTPHYAAPEDLAPSGHPLAPAADVFSLGVCIWEAMSGQKPWHGASSAVVAARVAQAGERLPIPSSWSPRIRALLGACWHANPAARPPAAHVMTELDAEIRTVLASTM